MSASIKEYLDHIRTAATSIFEGMSVTMSYMFRRPTTVQYPDRIERPIHETLPARYRGFLEVDPDICTACLACERACPIDCIKIDAEKDKETRRLVMSRFDIDIAKCMFCGLCSEPCPTGAIAHTPHFEASTAFVENLIFRFVPQDGALEAFKPIKGYDAPRARRGQILEAMGLVHRAARDRAFLPPPLDLPALAPPAPPPPAADKGTYERPLGEPSAYAPRAIGLDRPALAELLVEVMAGTDCGICDWPTCREYAVAIAEERDASPSKCAPAGPKGRFEAEMLFRSFKAGAVVPEARSEEAAKGPEAPGAPGLDSSAATGATGGAPGAIQRGPEEPNEVPQGQGPVDKPSGPLSDR